MQYRRIILHKQHRKKQKKEKIIIRDNYKTSKYLESVTLYPYANTPHECAQSNPEYLKQTVTLMVELGYS